ncbi:Arc family DNA-binding protein [Rhizobium phaseoli]|uniref:Arc family DNA-binding protein n=1 Tax=Rhizobium phaseoli TaxID=396 RepID=UPI000F881343|nr:Arc family DNA-binding protein [Rhizobium phaseoli]RUM18712.1 Arc family DNA-binding protein [Rhizobium phaseoli]
MGREDPQLKLRLPEEMKDKITEAAKTMGRSVNAEIVARLTESFQDPLVLPLDVLSRLERRSQELRVPVRSLVLSAVDKHFPAGYRLGEFIEKWALNAVHATSRAERSRIIVTANDDSESRVSGLSMSEQIYDEGSEILVYQLSDDVNSIIATLPASKIIQE